jgi:hypothetical protein
MEIIVQKFRKFFPISSRKALTAEFKKLSNSVFNEDSKRGVGGPLEFAEFKIGMYTQILFPLMLLLAFISTVALCI